ncbi:MAG: hypothetical protein HYU66_22145 [Armatimonadetes bacterium]|nr:hypothetical protein [Armatimonadota bacterium]
MTPRPNLAWVFLGLTLAATWTVHVLDAGVWSDEGPAVEIHHSILDGTADYPHQYRILVPHLCNVLERAGVPLEHAYLLQRFTFWYFSVLLLHGFLAVWTSEELAFGGAALFAGLLPFSCLGQGFQETDPLNLLLFVSAYALLLARRDAWLFVVVAVGVLNRETILLVPLLAAVVRLDESRTADYWRLVLGLVVVGAVLFLGVHLAYGHREAFTNLVTPSENLPVNLGRFGSLRMLVLYGALWWYALTGLGQQPAFLRRSAWLIPVFVVVHLGWGLVGETRYFLPLAPTVLSLALRRLFPESAREVPN